MRKLAYALLLVLASAPASADVREDCEKLTGDAGIAACDRAIKQTPDNGFIYVDRGTHHLRKGDLDAALADFNKAVALEPTSGSTFFGRAITHMIRQDFSRALADYQKAIELNPGFPLMVKYKGITQFAMGDFQGAARDFAPVAACGNDAQAMLLLFVAKARAGDNALPELQANLGRVKAGEWPRAAVELFLGTRQPDQALAAAKTAEQRCEAQFFLGQWHLLKGQKSDAAAAFKQGLTTCAKTADFYAPAVAELARIDIPAASAAPAPPPAAAAAPPERVAQANPAPSTKSADKPAVPAAQAAERLQRHLRNVFKSDVRVTVVDDDNLTISVGDKAVMKAEIDDDRDFMISATFPAAAGGSKPDAASVQALLRGLLRSNEIVVIAEKEANAFKVRSAGKYFGSADVSDAGNVEVTASVFLDDTPLTPASLMSNIEPVDSANATYFARQRASVREAPDGDSAAVTELSDSQKVKVTGKTRNSRVAAERWYQLEFADGKPRFVLGKDLISEKQHAEKARYRGLSYGYSGTLDNIERSQGALKKYMGFYTLGPDCKLQPSQLRKVESFDNSSGQRLQDLLWSTTSATLWSDGSYFYRATVEGKTMRYRPTFFKAMKFNTIGPVQFYRMERLEPPGFDADFATTGFAENGKILIDVKIDGNSAKWLTITRCNNLPGVKSAIADFYTSVIARLPVED